MQNKGYFQDAYQSNLDEIISNVCYSENNISNCLKYKSNLEQNNYLNSNYVLEDIDRGPKNYESYFHSNNSDLVKHNYSDYFSYQNYNGFDLNSNNRLDQKNNQENYFETNKSGSDLYENSLGKTNSDYYTFGKNHLEGKGAYCLQNESVSCVNEKENIKKNLSEKNSENIEIHNIIFSERNDKNEVNEESDFFKNNYFFTKNDAIEDSKNDIEFGSKILKASFVETSENKDIFKVIAKERYPNKIKKQHKNLLSENYNLKNIEKIFFLINTLFVGEITNYDKFILIYKIGNILKQNNNILKILVLEIIDKYRKRKFHFKDSSKENLKNDFINFKGKIKLIVIKRFSIIR